MTGTIIPVTRTNQSQLYEYCGSFAGEHDSSYLPGRDFELSREHPSYLLVESNQVIGAVSLMKTRRLLQVGKARFSIFHALAEDLEAYQKLFKAIQPHIQDLKSAYLFIPENRQGTAAIFRGLGFQIERYSFILERDGPALPDPDFPAGYTVDSLQSGDLEGTAQFAACLNDEFKDLAGHSPSTADDIQSWFEDQSYLEGGLSLLKKDGKPIGTLAAVKDLDDLTAGEISAFGVVREYQGLGLGRRLFRFGVNFLLDQGFSPVTLSVNGENHNAIRLYESEGFRLIESVVCLSYRNA